MNLTKKQILINQILTDVFGLRDYGNDNEIDLIVDKINKLKEIEDEEVEEAEREDAMKDEAEEIYF